MYNSMHTINTLHKELNMPYTVTVISTKPPGTEWWDATPPNSIAREELFAWIAEQPGFFSVTPLLISTDSRGNEFVFDTQANYLACVAAQAQQAAAITRAAYNATWGISMTTEPV
jgi:hypothetical protein